MTQHTRTFTRTLRTALAAVLLAGGSLVHAADITVSAAASLTDAFREIGQAYEKQYPDAKVHLNFAGSGTLLQQMAKGAPVDVFASADQATMDQAQQQNLIDPATRRDFVRNTLVLIVPMENPAGVRTLADLAGDKVNKIAIGNPASVPVGRYTMKVLDGNPHWPAMAPKVIHTLHVRQALNYVSRGEVEAGFVYGTDAALMRDRVKVASEVPVSTPIVYPLAVSQSSRESAEAKRFVEYVLSPAAQAVLQRFGFQPAPAAAMKVGAGQP